MNKGNAKTGAIFKKKPFQGQRKGPKAVIPNKGGVGAAGMPPPMPMMPSGGMPGSAPAMPGRAQMLAKMLAGGMPDTDSDMM